MATLDDLPPYRRAHLLWRWAHQGLAYVERMVQAADSRTCTMPFPPPAPPGVALAVLGNDNRFHLVWDSRMLCGDPESHGGAGHRQYCSWVEGDSGCVPAHVTCREDQPNWPFRHVVDGK